MKLPIRLVIFDLGSTLIYEKDVWDGYFPRADDALWEALHGAGVHIDRREVYGEYESLFSVYYERRGDTVEEPTIMRVLEELLQNKGIGPPGETLRAAIASMYAVTQENWSAEQDAIPTLERLRNRGLRIALISNAADDDNTQALIDMGGFRSYLEVIVSSAAFGKRKPDASIFRSVLDQLDIPAAQTVMIGDDYEADILGANAVGIQSIWVTRRSHNTSPDTSRGRPTATVSTLSEIPALLGDIPPAN